MIKMKALLMHIAADTSDIGTVGICGPIFENKKNKEFDHVTCAPLIGEAHHDLLVIFVPEL